MANTPQESTLGPWRISLIAGAIQLQHGSTAFWIEADTEIELSDGPVLRASKKILQGTTLTLEFADGLSVIHRFGQAEDWLRVTTTILNRTTRALPLRQVRILAGKLEAGPANRIFSQSETMTGITGIFQLAGSFLSDSCLGLTDAAGTVAMVAGFEKLDEAFHRFQVTASPGETHLAPLCLREGVALASGAVLEISPLLVGRGESLSRLLNHYAEQVAQAMGARPSGETMTGWCSWYHYYGHETFADILGNARSLAASPLKKNLKVIQIDDGWNLPRRGHPRNWGDWSPGEKFPQGMRAVADELHSLGFRAGLWLAPFSVDPGSRLAREHPDWILRIRNASTGKLEPSGPGIVFGLDLTHPDVLAWLRSTFDRVFRDWAFDYVKIDFLIHSLFPGERHDPHKTSVEAFRQGMQVIRECAGKDKFILNCGSPLGPAIGLCDGMRIGTDVGGRWDAPMRLEEWPQGNCSIRAAAYPTLFRQWMNRVWWQNDPDCLLVRDRSLPCEVEAMTRLKSELPAPDLAVAPSDFGLSRAEAEFWVRAVWFTGGMALVSEVWPELASDRQALLQHAFPPHPWKVRWLDHYEHPDMCVLLTQEGPPMVGLFNLSEKSRTVTLPRSRLPASPRWREWLSGESIILKNAPVRFPALPPRCARIWMADGG